MEWYFPTSLTMNIKHKHWNSPWSNCYSITLRFLSCVPTKSHTFFHSHEIKVSPRTREIE